MTTEQRFVRITPIYDYDKLRDVFVCGHCGDLFPSEDAILAHLEEVQDAKKSS